MTTPEMSDVGQGFFKVHSASGDVYLARYEELEDAFDNFLALEHLPSKRLIRINKGHRKKFSSEIRAGFKTSSALELKARSHSELTRLLGYF